MSRQCITCGVEIDPRRINILPNIQTCTQHSIAEKKVAMTVQMGEGDHTWNETIIMSEKDFLEYEKQEELTLQLIGKKKVHKAEFLSFDEENTVSERLVVNPKED